MRKHIEFSASVPPFMPEINANLSTLQKRFSGRVRKTDGCWIWIGYIGSQGYGVISIGNKRLFASRASWVLHFGPVPSNLIVMHKCDNPICVNPWHLMLGTHADNMADAKNKGRNHFRKGHLFSKGEMNGRSKLTLNKVADMRVKRAAGRTYASLGKEYGVSDASVSYALNGKTWNL